MTPISQLSSAWDPAPLVLASALVAFVRFGQAFLRLRRRGRADHAGWDRPVLFAAGLGLVTLPLVSPLDAAGDEYLLSAHMLEHVLLGDAGPALLLLAVRGPLLVFMVPASVARLVTRNAGLYRLLGWSTRPLAALGIWASSIAVWHVPALFDSALRHPAVHDLEHATFLTAGFLVWAQLIDPAQRERLSLVQRVGLAGTVYVLGQILSAVLFLVPTPLYPAYAAQPARLFGLSALQDQQLAGLVMMGEQLLTLGTCVAILLVASVRESARDVRPARGPDEQLRTSRRPRPGRAATPASWPGTLASREPTRQPGS